MRSEHKHWQELYECACREQDHELRLHRIRETQKAMLEHAWFLEQTHGSDEECRKLERAAEGLRRIKLASQFN